MRFIKHPAKAFRYTFIWDQFWNCWKQKPKNAKQPTTKIPSRKPNLLLFGWLAGQVTHLLWFFVFEVVDVEIKRAGDGQTQVRHRGDQSYPGGPLLRKPDSQCNAMSAQAARKEGSLHFSEKLGILSQQGLRGPVPISGCSLKKMKASLSLRE